MISLVCLLCALIFGVLATAAVPSHPRFNWLPAAFTFFVLHILLGKI